MARLTREESQGQTRERLIESARKVVARSGIAGASVNDIAEAAGFSKGAFYSNFESKEAILLELLRQHKARAVGDFRDAIDQGDNLSSILTDIRALVEAQNREDDWALLAIELQLHATRSPSFAAEYGEVNREHRQALGQLVGALFAKTGKKPPGAVDELAAGLIALVQGLHLLRGPGSPPPAELAGRLVILFLKGWLGEATDEDPRSVS